MGNLKLASVMTIGGHGDEEETETLALSLEARPVKKFVRIYGTDMSLHIDLATNMPLRLRAPTDGIIGRALANVDQSVHNGVANLGQRRKTLTGRLSRGHDTLIERFYAALRRGETPPAGGEEGLATVVVLDDLWKALGRGHEATCVKTRRWPS